MRLSRARPGFEASNTESEDVIQVAIGRVVNTNSGFFSHLCQSALLQPIYDLLGSFHAREFFSRFSRDFENN